MGWYRLGVLPTKRLGSRLVLSLIMKLGGLSFTIRFSMTLALSPLDSVAKTWLCHSFVNRACLVFAMDLASSLLDMTSSILSLKLFTNLTLSPLHETCRIQTWLNLSQCLVWHKLYCFLMEALGETKCIQTFDLSELPCLLLPPLDEMLENFDLHLCLARLDSSHLHPFSYELGVIHA